MESLDAQIFTLYPYQRLSSEDCIRLMYVKPFSRRRKTVQCEIKEFPLQKCAPFESLSYEWGPEDPSGLGWPLMVNEKHALVARRNFQTALLLYSSENDAIWIDDIYINQRDLEERAKQSLCMRDIYAAASEVKLFLSQDHGRALDIFSAITEIYCWYGRHVGTAPIYNEHTTINAFAAGHIEHVSSQHLLTEVFILVGKLWDASYLSCMWMFQEVASAKSARLQSGIWSLPWQTVEDYILAGSLVTRVKLKRAHVNILQRYFTPCPS